MNVNSRRRRPIRYKILDPIIGYMQNRLIIILLFWGNNWGNPHFKNLFCFIGWLMLFEMKIVAIYREALISGLYEICLNLTHYSPAPPSTQND